MELAAQEGVGTEADCISHVSGEWNLTTGRSSGPLRKLLVEGWWTPATSPDHSHAFIAGSLTLPLPYSVP